MNEFNFFYTISVILYSIRKINAKHISVDLFLCLGIYKVMKIFANVTR